MTNNARTQQQVNLIWKHTHRDYRGELDAKKSIMFNDNGATKLSAVIDLPDDVWANRLASAIRSEAKSVCNKKLTPLLNSVSMPEHTLLQFRSSEGEFLEQMKYLLNDDAVYQSFEQKVRAANITFVK